GRDSSGKCLPCKADSIASSRKDAARDALRVRQEALEERWEQVRRETERRERAILRRGGPKALDLLQRRAFEDGRCGWYLSATAVCQRPADPVTYVWCRRHNRQLDREQGETT